MAGEVEFFRKRFVGGFNRDDVVKYIAKLSQERNDWRAAKEKADEDIHALTDRIADMSVEVTRAKQEAREALEYKAAEIDAAAEAFLKLEAAYAGLCADLETTTESICTELDQARRTVTALPDALSNAGKSISEMRAACEAEKAATLEAIEDER